MVKYSVDENPFLDDDIDYCVDCGELCDDCLCDCDYSSSCKITKKMAKRRGPRRYKRKRSSGGLSAYNRFVKSQMRYRKKNEKVTNAMKRIARLWRNRNKRR